MILVILKIHISSCTCERAGRSIFTQNQHELLINSSVRDIFNKWGIFLWYFSIFIVWDLRNRPPTYPATSFISFTPLVASFCPGLKTQFIYLELLQPHFESTEGWWRENTCTDCTALCSLCRLTMWKMVLSSLFCHESK